MRFSRTFRFDLGEISFLRAFIREALSDLDEIVLNHIILATDEICTNAIQHGGAHIPLPVFTVSILHANGKVEVEITDSTQPFPIEKIVEVDCWEKIRNREKGGLGLFLVQKVMDEISVEAMGNHQVIRLRKFI